jgi:hypothetical protein
MDFFIIELMDKAWVLVPLGAFVYLAYIGKLRTQQRIAELNAAGESAQVTGMREEIASLKSRVAVLERLATDTSGRLSDQIERLR